MIALVVGFALASLPAPTSLALADVEAWTARHVQAKGWGILAHDQEGVKLAERRAIRLGPEGWAEAEVRTELFQPVTLSVGAARSGVARWSVDCANGRLAVREMTVYARNNLKDQIGHKLTAGPLWQAPVGSEADTMRAICRAVGRQAVIPGEDL